MIFIKNKIIKIILVLLIFNILSINYIYGLSPQDELIYEGIDVSSWQRTIDYSQVKKAGIDVVYIKASEGRTLIDPYIEINYKNAKANNLKIGFYHFLTATTISVAETQARFFASVIEGKEYNCKLAMDYEQFHGLEKARINEIAVAFIKKLKEITGKEVIIYSNANNLRNTFDSSVANQGKLWLAYYSNPDYLVNFNYAWNTYIGIQYTSTGRVPGIIGNVDRDKFSKEILLKDIDNSNNNQDENNSQIIYYVVKRGDTLSEIALEYGTTVNEIAKLNGIKNVNLIYPGQVFKIYVNSSNQESELSNFTFYTIKRGDTLWEISKIYGVSIQELADWNNIKNPNLIYTGNILKIYVKGENNISNNKYIVKRGDTLSEIAIRFGTSVTRLAQINGIKNPNLIYVGQTIFIY